MSTSWRLQRPSFLGFDNLFDEIEQLNNRVTHSFPPYNLVKSGTGYVIELALAGFTKSDITLTHDKKKKHLVIAGDVENSTEAAQDEPAVELIHKGIATRSFKSVFTIADELEVESASMENGILKVKLRLVETEENKPKLIEIN